MRSKITTQQKFSMGLHRVETQFFHPNLKEISL